MDPRNDTNYHFVVGSGCILTDGHARERLMDNLWGKLPRKRPVLATFSLKSGISGLKVGRFPYVSIHPRILSVNM